MEANDEDVKVLCPNNHMMIFTFQNYQFKEIYQCSKCKKSQLCKRGRYCCYEVFYKKVRRKFLLEMPQTSQKYNE